MTQKQHVSTSKFLSLVLRHNPDKIGITLDSGGWVPVNDLLAAMARHGKPLDRATLIEIVNDCEKQRYAFSSDGQHIRANQGHSVEVELEHAPAAPPEHLYHGTAEQFLGAVRGSGPLIKTRLNEFAKKNFEWMIYMPTPSGDTPIDLLIPNPDLPPITVPGLKIGGAPVVLKFGGGGGGFRGRVLGLGIWFPGRTATEARVFRMDYHRKHGKGSADIDYWEYQWKYTFHGHTRKN